MINKSISIAPGDHAETNNMIIRLIIVYTIFHHYFISDICKLLYIYCILYIVTNIHVYNSKAYMYFHKYVNINMFCLSNNPHELMFLIQ